MMPQAPHSGITTRQQSQKRLLWVCIALTLILAAVCATPAGAFTAKDVVIHVQPDGSATITADYSLSWIESGIFMTMKNTFQNAAEQGLDSVYNGKASLNLITDKQASVTLPTFAKVTQGEDALGTGIITYKTPSLPYDKANQLVEKKASEYLGIAASMVPKNMYPAQTTVTFPDGYTESFGEVTVVPSVVHAIPA